jgi:hypothetical protein
MLSTLLLTFACAAPAQEPVAPLIDSFPADSLITVELSLEPWDRLRKQTAAHVLFRGRNMLKNAIAIAAPLGNEDAANEMRAVLGSARFLVAITPESLGMGGLLLAVEPINFGAAAFDWPAHLLKLTGVPAQKLGSGFVTVLQAPDAFDAEAATAYLSQLSKAAATGENSLGMHAGWKSLHRAQMTRDDLLRVTIPGWNWNEQSMFSIAKAVEPGQAGLMSSMLVSMAELMGLQHGLALNTSIRGSEIIDAYYLPRPVGAPSMLASIGKKKKAFARFESLPVIDGTVYLQGVDATQFVASFQTMASSLMAQLGMEIEDEPIVAQTFESLRACAAQLGPEVLSFTSLESMQATKIGAVRLAVRDRAALEAAWESMPTEITSVIPGLIAASGGATNALALEDAWLELNAGSIPKGTKPLAEWEEYLAIRDQAMQYVQPGEDVLSISFATTGFAELTWEMANEALAELGDQFGFEYLLGPTRPNDSKAFRPTWSIMKRSARGIEGEAHSSFGSFLFGGLAATKAMMDSQNAGVIPDLDEEEF